MTKSKSKNPPKNRDFLGLDEVFGYKRWRIYFWNDHDWGDEKSAYVDYEGYEMPKLIRWEELPEIEGGDN